MGGQCVTGNADQWAVPRLHGQFGRPLFIKATKHIFLFTKVAEQLLRIAVCRLLMKVKETCQPMATIEHCSTCLVLQPISPP